MLFRRIGTATLLCAALEVVRAGQCLAQSVPNAGAHTPWRETLRAWCAESATTECSRAASLDPDPDPAHRNETALLAADRAAREISALALAAGGQPTWAQTLRETPAMRDVAAATPLLAQLLNAYVALLPPASRSLARGWMPDSFWHDAEAAQTSASWRRRVHDAGSPAAALREQITRAAMLVQRAGTPELTGDAALDEATELGAMAIARGALRDDVIRVVIAAIEAMPTRPPPPDPNNDGPPDHPSRRQVLIAMESARSQVSRCMGTQDGTIAVRVTFGGSDGHVSDATVTGTFANTIVGSCSRTAVLSASVPPFERDSVTVNYPFVIFGAHPDRQPRPPVIPPAASAVRTPPPVTNNPPVEPPPTHTTPPPAHSDQTLPPQPAQEDLDRVFTTLEGPVRACAPSVRGTIDIEATISSTGLPDHVAASARGLGSDARDCIEQAVMNAQFPTFTNPQVTVTHHVSAPRHRH